MPLVAGAVRTERRATRWADDGRRTGDQPALGGFVQSFDQIVDQGHCKARPDILAQLAKQVGAHEQARLLVRVRHAVEPGLHEDKTQRRQGGLTRTAGAFE